MAKRKTIQIKWLPELEDHDYPAARSFLDLIYETKMVAKIVARLRKAPITKFKAKDVFRASQLPLLGLSNYHVERDHRRIMTGKPLCPLLLVRDSDNGRVIVADGYHRMCAVYSLDEDAFVYCKIVG